jgi:hypothetical protein
MLSAPRASRSNGAVLCTLKSREAKRRDGLISRQVSIQIGRPRLSRQDCGPESRMPSALRVSRLGGARPSVSKSRWAKRRGAYSRTTCPCCWTALILSGNRGSRFLHARVSCRRKPRFSDELNPTLRLMSDACPVEING